MIDNDYDDSKVEAAIAAYNNLTPELIEIVRGLTVFEAVVLYRVLKMAENGTVAPQRKPRADKGTKRTPKEKE